MADWISAIFDELEASDDPSDGLIDYIHSLIEQSIYDEPKKTELERELFAGITKERAEELYSMLINDQVEPISAGKNYGTTEITRKLKREIRDR